MVSILSHPERSFFKAKRRISLENATCFCSKFLESRFYKILRNKKKSQGLETKNRPFSRFAIAKLFQGDEEFVLLMRNAPNKDERKLQIRRRKISF